MKVRYERNKPNIIFDTKKQIQTRRSIQTDLRQTQKQVHKRTKEGNKTNKQTNKQKQKRKYPFFLSH